MAKLRFAIGLILLDSLLGSVFPINPVGASPGVVKWSEVNIPTEGRLDKWVLASGSDIQHLTMAIDGTLYCYANLQERATHCLNPQMEAIAGHTPEKLRTLLLILPPLLMMPMLSTTPPHLISTGLLMLALVSLRWLPTRVGLALVI